MHIISQIAHGMLYVAIYKLQLAGPRFRLYSIGFSLQRDLLSGDRQDRYLP